MHKSASNHSSAITLHHKPRMRSGNWPSPGEVEYTGWELYNETMYRVVTHSAAAEWVGWKEWNLGCYIIFFLLKESHVSL